MTATVCPPDVDTGYAHSTPRSVPDAAAFVRETSFNRAQSEPIYYQLGESIISAVHQRRIRPGAPLPSHRALADRWRVTRGTVRSTIHYLDKRSYLHWAGQQAYLVEPHVAPQYSPQRRHTPVTKKH
ncbi:GntR family transcriptional regulator [Rhodococcus koreensis]